MNSTDGIDPARRFSTERQTAPVSAADAKKLARTAEDYVRIENRLAAQTDKPADPAQFTSIFDELRNRMGK